MSYLCRFGAGALGELAGVCAELGVARPLLVASARGARVGAELPVAGTYAGVRPHVPVETVRAAAAQARQLEADGIVALGGGSAIDTAKAAVVELLGRDERDGRAREAPVPRIVAVPTTYAGAEWTPFFGLLLAPGHKGGGSDGRARPAAAIYDPQLTLGLPVPETVGTALNALAHCAEAYYHPATGPRALREADAGAALIADALPRVVAHPFSLEARAPLLEGAMHAALALAESGLCVGHALAQALGGRYGLPHGAMNAVCLPAALRFNAVVSPGAVARFGRALGAADPATRVRELAALGGFGRLRDLGVPAEELGEVAEAAARRAGARANPRPVTVADAAALLRSVW
jgi:maleylacetate reductase